MITPEVVHPGVGIFSIWMCLNGLQTVVICAWASIFSRVLSKCEGLYSFLCVFVYVFVICACVHAFVLVSMHLCVYVCVFIRVEFVFSVSSCVQLLCVYAFVCVCVYKCVFILCVHVSSCYVCMRVCVSPKHEIVLHDLFLFDCIVCLSVQTRASCVIIVCGACGNGSLPKRRTSHGLTVCQRNMDISMVAIKYLLSVISWTIRCRLSLCAGRSELFDEDVTINFPVTFKVQLTQR